MGKITRRLVLYFVLLLLVFSILIGVLFFYQFSRQTSQFYREELEKRAAVISRSFQDGLMEPFDLPFERRGNSRSDSPGMGGMLRFLDEIAMGEVWIVDRDARTISVGSNRHAIKYAELPQEAIELLDQVFEGNISSSEKFGTILGRPSVTAGAPIQDTSGNVIGAVLLHRQIEDIQSAEETGILILLVSMLAALAVSALLAVFLANRFNQPLERMARTAERLTEGDYAVSTGVSQDDEIGLLAENIDNLAGKLQSAAEEREKLEKMRSDFIANVSHELRTPVTVIRGSVEALTDGVVSEPEKVAEYHRQMFAESIQLERMVNDLLELTRLQNPDYKIERSEINLSDVVEDAVRSIRRIADAKEVAILFEKTPVQSVFYGDYGRLRQMFLIVLDNAVKFSDRGGSVTVTTALTGKNYSVSIRDQGQGIPPDEIPYLFSRFYKGTGSEGHKGSGLGLAIAREIADRHEVDISVQSEENKGSVFQFRFPV